MNAPTSQADTRVRVREKALAADALEARSRGFPASLRRRAESLVAEWRAEAEALRQGSESISEVEP